MMTQHSGRSSSLRGVVDRPVLALAALCSVLLVLPTLVAGQNPPPPAQAAAALQQAVSQNPGLANVIRQRIGQSGMTPDQIRARHVQQLVQRDRKSTRLNSSHMSISYAVFCLKKKK